MIDDMEALDGLSGSCDDGNIQSQLFALNTDVLGQIAMFLKPADVYSLSLTCKHLKENVLFMICDNIIHDHTCIICDN